jgi:elongation factor G
MKAYTFEGEHGEDVVEHEIPEEYKEEAEMYREELIEKISAFDDKLAEKYLEGEEITEEEIKAAIRK